jgi:predicted lipid-binding transport protein (Tim44 family)
MKSLIRFFVLLTCLVFLSAPNLADARAGSSSSMGSRGSQTYQYNGAAPLQRSVTPMPQSQFGSPGIYGGGYAHRPFLTGLLGGFVGAGLAGMLFGHGFYGGGLGGAGFFGMLLQIILIGFLVNWLFKAFRGSVGMGGGATGVVGSLGSGVYGVPGSARAPAPAAGAPIVITDADFQEFSTLLVNIQDAWSHTDLSRLRQFVTPEMLGYFSELLSANSSQGVVNRVEQVKLLDGSLSQAWHEYGMDYASTRIRFSALDYMIRLDHRDGDPQAVVSGSLVSPVEAVEMWTFVRSTGGHWLLSAIQQM